MQWLMKVTNQVNQVFQGLELVGIRSTRLEHCCLPFSASNQAIAVWAVTFFT